MPLTPESNMPLGAALRVFGIRSRRLFETVKDKDFLAVEFISNGCRGREGKGMDHGLALPLTSDSIFRFRSCSFDN
jgi:hypothetical protein